MLQYLIVGAGPSGLCMAKTILECDEGADVKLLDANKTLGGVWARENLYQGLKTNNLRGGIDFSDFPMHDGFGIAEGEHVTGEAMHEYLKDYAARHDITKLIDFETRVEEVWRIDNRDGRGWDVKVHRGGETTVLQTEKLVIATGINHEPHRPVFVGADTFERPIIHSAELGLKQELMEDDDVKIVTVLGGGKSAFDAVHLAGRTGHSIHWIMRKSGKGAEWVFPSHAKIGPFSFVRERLAAKRCLAFLSPWFWPDFFFHYRALFHFTKVGRWLARKFWSNLHAKTRDQCGMMNHELTKVLEPAASPFWYGTASGIYSYEKDIYEMIKTGQVRVYREDIAQLSPNTITLASGQDLTTHMLITATGFSAKPSITFTPASIHHELGIPSASYTHDQHEFWIAHNTPVDRLIWEYFPDLIRGPPNRYTGSTRQEIWEQRLKKEVADKKEKPYTPFRLYRAIAPPGPTADGDRSLVFIGMFSNLANTPRCELQCLWAYAYLTGKLDDIDSIEPESVYPETALLSRYAKYRSPYGHGSFFPDLVFDQLGYFDLLLQDLQLEYRRKSNFLAELFGSYDARDYRGIVQEWIKAAKAREDAAQKKMSKIARQGEIEALLQTAAV